MSGPANAVASRSSIWRSRATLPLAGSSDSNMRPDLYHPDWVICDASVLDTWLEDTHLHSVVQHHIPIPFPFVQQAVNHAGVKATDSLDAFRTKFEGASERFLDEVYAGWSVEARRLGCPLTVVVLPRADSKAKSPRVVRVDQFARRPKWAGLYRRVPRFRSTRRGRIPQFRVG